MACTKDNNSNNIKKVRNRVPLSCLICKRRKVKCDKQRPACGGCIKNGVSHLCEYLEPKWAEDVSSVHRDKKASSGDVKDSDEYKFLKRKKDKIIEEQRLEIQNLRRQIEINNRISRMDNREIEYRSTVTIFSKLVSDFNPHRNQLDFGSQFYSIDRRKLDRIFERSLDTYSWSSIVKVDPSLTALWYKITSLQKAYHVYKMQVSTGKISENKQLSQGFPAPSRIASPFRLSEMASTRNQNSPMDIKKCPIADCDLIITKDSPASSKDMESPQVTPGFKLKEVSDDISSEKNDSGTDKILEGPAFLTLIYDVWRAALFSANTSEELKCSQIRYLLDQFYNNEKNTESRPLVGLFKSEIYDIIQDFSEDSVPTHELFERPYSDSESSYFIISGIYICIFALILEEALDFFQLEFDRDSNSPIIQEFLHKFQSERNLKLDYKRNIIVPSTESFLISLSLGNVSDEARNSLPFLTCCILWCNSEIRSTKGQGFSLDSQRSIGFVLNSLLSSLSNENGLLEIWSNPSVITLMPGSQIRSPTDVRFHLCAVSMNILRLCNLVCLKFFTPKQKVHSLFSKIEHIYKNMIYYGIDEHVQFLTALNESKALLLLHLFKNHFLICRILMTIRDAITNRRDPKITYHSIISFSKEIESILEGDIAGGNQRTMEIESSTILNYLRLTLDHYLMLQSEEDNHGELSEIYFTNEFRVFCSILNQMDTFSTCDIFFGGSGVTLHILLEILKREIQLFVAILIRIDKFENNVNRSSLSNIFYKLYSNEDDIKDIVISGLEIKSVLQRKIISRLNSILAVFLANAKEKTPVVKNLLRLWGLYCTFVYHYNKTDYARIHENVIALSKSNLGLLSKCPIHKELFCKKPDSDLTQSPEGCTHRERLNIKVESPSVQHITRTNLNNKNLGNENALKRKCPFDYEKMDFTSSSATLRAIEAVESNTRGQQEPNKETENEITKTKKSEDLVGSNATWVNHDYKAEIFKGLSANAYDNLMKPNLGYEDFDHDAQTAQYDVWPSVNNIDFDILGNGFLFEQGGLGSLEDLFK